MPSSKQQEQQTHAHGAIRHAEKRRTSTCTFADRVAKTSIQSFHSHIPLKWREENKQVCLATFVACWTKEGEQQGKSYNSEGYDGGGGGHDVEPCTLKVVGLGVGTKFLSGDLLSEEEHLQSRSHDGNSNKNGRYYYGMRIRDLHAEILARRAFRQYLMVEMHALLDNNMNQYCDHYILEYDSSVQRFHLKSGVTIHMYSSSTPCGNSVIKKFAQLSKERFQSHLNKNQWPQVYHDPIPAHSIHLGQFSLLVKKDYNAGKKDSTGDDQDGCKHEQIFHPPLSRKQKSWPSITDDGWCPPGTSTVYHGKGTIHTCSDKICRWNCLGLQGSFLASLLKDGPIFMTSITVGRKFSNCVCRRAICCRALGYDDLVTKDRIKNQKEQIRFSDSGNHDDSEYSRKTTKYTLNHPTIMGTAVYLDDSGVLDMSATTNEGQDVRFLSNQCWIWWPSLFGQDGNQSDSNQSDSTAAECVDGETGLIIPTLIKNEFVTGEQNGQSGSCQLIYSEASTYAFTKSFINLLAKMNAVTDEDSLDKNLSQWMSGDDLNLSVKALRRMKGIYSPDYEHVKDILLNQHLVFKHWRRRCHQII